MSTTALLLRARLIVARARTATIYGGGGKVGDNDEPSYIEAGIVDLHLTLSRALLLLGATEEADGHARAVERLLSASGVAATATDNIEGKEVWVSDGDGEGGGGKSTEISKNTAAAASTALRLEIELLSRTPVVLETVEDAASLRRSLLAEMESLSKGTEGDEFNGSIATPLEVGVRAQFLATYQVR